MARTNASNKPDTQSLHTPTDSAGPVQSGMLAAQGQTTGSHSGSEGSEASGGGNGGSGGSWWGGESTPARKAILGAGAFLLCYALMRLLMYWMRVDRDTILWDPTAGLCFAFLVLFGPKYTPVVLVAAFVSSLTHVFIRAEANVWDVLALKHAAWQSAVPRLQGIALFALAFGGVYAAGAALTRWWVGEKFRITQVRHTLIFGAVAIVVPLPLAAYAAYSHVQRGFVPADELSSAFFYYWVIEAIGALAAGGVVVGIAAWMDERIERVRVRYQDASVADRRNPGLVEGVFQFAACSAGLYITHVSEIGDARSTKYLMVLPLVWIAMRRGVLGVAFALGFMYTASMILVGKFGLGSESLADMQTFMIISAVSMYLFGAISSQSKRSEQALAASEERYRVLFEHNPHAMWMYDRERGVFLDVNQSAVVQYGYSREEFMKMNLSQLAVRTEAKDKNEGGTTSITAKRIKLSQHRTRNGDVIDVDLISTAMRSLGEHVRLTLARNVTESLRDQREKQQVEAALRETLQRLVSLVDHSPLAVIEWDSTFRVVRWSGSAERIFGWSSEEVVGKRPFEWKFVHPEDSAMVHQVLEKLSVGRERVSLLNRNYTKFDDIVHCEWYNSVIFDQDGKLQRVLSLVADVTERMKVQMRLKHSEERFKLAVAGTNDGVWDWDIVLGTTYWSPRYRELIGDDPLNPKVSTSYEAWEQRVHPDDRLATLLAIREHLETRRPFDIEYRHFNHDGTIRWFRGRGQAIWDSTGKPLRMAGSISDVTERRLFQEQLKETAEKYRLLVETTRTGYAVLDEAGRVIDANDEYARLAGEQSPAQVVGQLASTWTFCRQGDQDPIKMALEHGFARGVETVYRSNAGTEIPVEVNATLVQTVQGSRVLALVRDISQRKRAAAAVVEQKNRYDAAAAASGQLLYELEYDTGTIVWGTDTANVFGCQREDIGTLSQWIQRIHPLDLDTYKTAKQELEKTREGFHLEYRVKHDDGGYLHVEDTARFYTDATGQTTRMVGFVADVSERAKAREELAKRAAELARSNAELERFAYVASHDLQEPLRMVTSFTQLLADRYQDKLDPEAREYIGFAVEGATRMRRLIDDLLAYSRVASAPRRVEMIDANKCVQRAMANLRMAIDESHAKIEVGDLPLVRADETHLTLVIQNLLSNAIKFRGDDAPHIRVWAQEEPSLVRLRIADNGIGIDPAHRLRIFQMFQRLHTREKFPGNGIGLTICKRIIEDLGGCIQVEEGLENPQGKRGACFMCVLPKEQPHNP